MYDPKFTQKEMYDQYGSSRETTKTKPNPGKQFADTMKAGGGGRNTSGIGAKRPPSNTFGGGQDNNPNRDEFENKSTIDKLKEKAVNLFESLGADKPEALIVDGKRVYQGPLFSGYDPTVRIGQFGGDAGKKNYFLGIEKLGIPTYPRTDVSPTLPPSTINMFGVNTDNPRLNMFGVNRGFTGGPEGLQAAPTMTQPASPATARSAAMTAGINRILKEVVAPNSKEYKIKKGDTLSRIAVREGVTVDDLVKINGIEDKNKIYAGDSIIIPKPEEVEQAKEFVLRVSTRGDEMERFEGEVDLTDPQRQFYQSTVPEKDREYAEEGGFLENNPHTRQGIMVPQGQQNISTINLPESELLKLVQLDNPNATTEDIRQGKAKELKTKSKQIGSEIIRDMQQDLTDLGYRPNGVDGIYGGGTQRAIRKFQKSVGLAVTGKPDVQTQRALKNMNAPKYFDPPLSKAETKKILDVESATGNILETFYENDFNIFAQKVAMKESTNRYNIHGGATHNGKKEKDGGIPQYDGKYQLGRGAKADVSAALTDKKEKAKLVHTTAIGNARKAFVNDDALQEKAFKIYTQKNHEHLTRHSKAYREMSDINKLSVLAYAHNQGATAAEEWMYTGVSGSDAFGTKGDEYTAMIKDRFSNREYPN